jgi:hypothetical protein
VVRIGRRPQLGGVAVFGCLNDGLPLC